MQKTGMWTWDHGTGLETENCGLGLKETLVLVLHLWSWFHIVGHGSL